MVLPGKILVEMNPQEFERLGCPFLMDSLQFETIQVDVRDFFFWIAEDDEFCFTGVDREVIRVEPFRGFLEFDVD